MGLLELWRIQPQWRPVFFGSAQNPEQQHKNGQGDHEEHNSALVVQPSGQEARIHPSSEHRKCYDP